MKVFLRRGWLLALLVLAGCANQVPAPTVGATLQPEASPTQAIAVASPTTSVATPVDTLPQPNAFDDQTTPVKLFRSLVNALNRGEYERAYRYWATPPGGIDQGGFSASFFGIDLVVGLVTAPTFNESQTEARMAGIVLLGMSDGGARADTACYLATRADVNSPWQLSSNNSLPTTTNDVLGVLDQQARECGTPLEQLALTKQTTVPEVLFSYYAGLAQADQAKTAETWVEGTLPSVPDNLRQSNQLSVYVNVTPVETEAAAFLQTIILADTKVMWVGCYGASQQADTWRLNSGYLQASGPATVLIQTLTQGCDI
ncbi:MAG TPA: hypothetical protein DEF47_00840 [Herpetosiphon sp.]|uniref:Lipoprotein n=1 Tax=Herpetosiphon aurantiacus (strain ATCC 23779 / DSM 785 / 114-95) TaxID=316274 RepID=A9B215_HERA2|nr:hypothetical protein [Herpetosiphon sp.]ABX07365.1 hypothetical protein Haur_4734 [Herpetosiphon aurantiacus DSM 785]HBW48434.1 hypothetical protein [Herpetosiphon sp.]